MNKIICPTVKKKAFKVGEAVFADIIKQVRYNEFEEELAKRLTLAEHEKVSAVKLTEANLRNSFTRTTC
jgi:copper oxidase (laccase) domain-containing protein